MGRSNTLAALGGKPAIDETLSHGRYPTIGDRERAAVLEALNAERLWGPWGKQTRTLETLWADLTRVRFCAALNSGTAALHCAVVGAGVRAGDEVIVPAYTFIGTAGAVMMAGGIPIFADVDPVHGNLDPFQVERHITPRTRAILMVHLHGQPAVIGPLRDIARRHGLVLIEDCAQAHGASVQGIPVGALGDVGAFSLNATKLLAGPEGGLLTTNREDIYDRAARLRVFGVTHRDGRSVVRNTDCLGYSYRTNELMSSFALARLAAFDHEQQVRVANANLLIAGLRDLAGVQVPTEIPGSTHVYQMFRLRLDPDRAGVAMAPGEFRTRVLAALNAEGARFWTWEVRSLPEYTIFRTRNSAGGGFPWCISGARQDMAYDPADVPVARATAQDAIFTTSHYPPNTPELMYAYVAAFRKVWANLDALIAIALPLEQPVDEVEDFTG